MIFDKFDYFFIDLIYSYSYNTPINADDATIII